MVPHHRILFRSRPFALLSVGLLLLTGTAASAAPEAEAEAEAASDTAANQTAPSKSVLVMDLKYGEGITKDNAYVMTQEVATVLARDPLVRVQTVEDTRVTLGVEAQKQMMGCGETSCLAEIAQAMGTEMLLFGRLDRVGSRVTLQITVLDSLSAQPKVRVSTKDDDVASILVRMDDVLIPAKQALNPSFVVEEEPAPLLLYSGLAGAGVGAVALTIGAIVGGIAFAQMTTPTETAEDREATRRGVFWPSVGVAVVGAGLAVASGAIALVGLGE